MSDKILIEPVSRIGGHGKISIYLDDRGEVENAHFHVSEYRGFEKFCEGRPMWEMAGITARICGICPVSHLIASSKTVEKIQAVTIPPAAKKLRRLINAAQIVQSHSLAFFHLCSPDFLLGWDYDPEKRNIFGLMEAEPELARGGIRLRQFGQKIIEFLGDRKIHSRGIVPGGMEFPLTEEMRTWIRDRLPESFTTIKKNLDIFKEVLDKYPEETNVFGNFPSLFMGLVDDDGAWEHYEGKIRVTDSDGNIVADNLSEDNYQDFIGEAVEKGTYLKFPYYKPWGYPEGNYRVGPLARLNICSRMNATEADRELLEYRDRAGRVATSSFYFNYARLIEILASLEKIEQLLDDPEITSTRIRATAGINQLEGMGVSEAPRGTLFHHYKVDENGLIQKVNLIIATGQNNISMNKTVAQIAKHYIHGKQIPEDILNRVEAGIRSFDPCLGCTTHAVGQMPLHIELVGFDGQILDEVWRN
ncbi:MAG: Ni/Fe hydrogenase subunit alpha [Prochloraceae cyanobacterium]|nr:Ni/Fe hydrogenase subunit alpha [Prochloraceae cyanobacterium]